MDKLSEYLPLLIILVSLVFTVIGKKKKQGEITQKTTLPGQTAGEFLEDSSQRPFTGLPQQFEEKPKKQVFHKQEVKPEKGVSSFFSAPVFHESEEEDTLSFSFEEDDAMRAIVYAEIINKKEY